MMNRNWCEWIADALQPFAGSAALYSNVDPDREFQGGVMLEVMEGESETTSFISGKSIIERSFTVACRAETYETAAEIAENVQRILSAALFTSFHDGEIERYYFEERDAAPDELGLNSGQSFAGYVKFKLTESATALY